MPNYQGMIPQHAAWIWTIRAFAVSTAIVGLGATGVAASISYGMGVSSVKEFSIEFKRVIQNKVFFL